MRFVETELEGVVIVELEHRDDERGFFARAFCQKEFEARGLTAKVAQCNLSFTRQKGTLRGVHFQRAPHEEAKLVRCTRGSIFDVALDLRPGSATFGRWFGVELTAENRKALFVPEGCAHGYQTLEEDTEVLYQVSAFYAPEAEGGVRWDDPRFAIRWPLPVQAISERDRKWPPFPSAEERERAGAR